jgi:hypothetical protein
MKLAGAASAVKDTQSSPQANTPPKPKLDTAENSPKADDPPATSNSVFRIFQKPDDITTRETAHFDFNDLPGPEELKAMADKEGPAIVLDRASSLGSTDENVDEDNPMHRPSR